MINEPRRFSFEAIYITNDEVTHHEYSVVAGTQAQAWEIATGAAQQAAVKNQRLLVAMSYLGWEEISEPAPFDAPYILDSPLWAVELPRN